MLLAFVIITFCIGAVAGYFAFQLSREYMTDGGVESDGVSYSKAVLPVILWVVSVIAFVGYMIGIAKFSGF